MSQDKEKNKKEKKVTLLSIMATGPACALIGYSLGERWEVPKEDQLGWQLDTDMVFFFIIGYIVKKMSEENKIQRFL